MKEELGDHWLQPDLFRFGASSLLTDIERQLEHYRHRPLLGRPPPPDGVSHDQDRARIFETHGLRPGAGERRARRCAWLAKHERELRPFHRRRVDRAGRDCSTSINPATSKTHRARHQRHDDGCRRRGAGGARGAAGLGGARRPRARAAISTRSRAHMQKHSRLFAVLETHRQRQADPRDPRHRHPAGRPPFLPSRRLGAAARHASSPATRPVGVVRPDHPVEFPAADAGLEDRAGARRRQHGGAEAGRVHAADRAAVRRDLRRGRPAAGRRQHRHRRRRDRRGARRPSRTSTRSPSPARPKSAGSSARRPPARARS